MAKGTYKAGWTGAVWVGMLAGSLCAAGEASASSPRVRSSDPALVALIDQAKQRSKTFNQLIQTIAATNGIGDWWPYGVSANRTAVDAVLRYHHEQGLTKRRYTCEDIFVPSLLNT